MFPTTPVWGRGGGLHQIFGRGIEYIMNKWTQSDVRFCKNEGQKILRTLKKSVNEIFDTKLFKTVKW